MRTKERNLDIVDGAMCWRPGRIWLREHVYIAHRLEQSAHLGQDRKASRVQECHDRSATGVACLCPARQNLFAPIQTHSPYPPDPRQKVSTSVAFDVEQPAFHPLVATAGDQNGGVEQSHMHKRKGVTYTTDVRAARFDLFESLLMALGARTDACSAGDLPDGLRSASRCVICQCRSAQRG